MYSRRVAVRSPLAVMLAFLICVALMPAPCISLLQSAIAQSRGKNGEHTPPSRPGKPDMLPDREELQRERVGSRARSPDQISKYANC